MVDNFIKGKTRMRREFCSFYTESEPILTYMVNQLEVKNEDVIMEPCAGDGVFIEKILTQNGKNKVKIEAFDLNNKAITNLKRTFYDFNNVKIRQADTLLDTSLDLLVNSGGYYTKIIGNPPYGAWQDYEKRNLLKKKYKGYVKETYTLFIERCLKLLKSKGKLVFIIPDTFLALHLHKQLRKILLTETKIEEILLIPSKFFPEVKFGYSNLCIVTLIKDKNNNDNVINIIKVSKSINDLYKIAEKEFSSVDYFEKIKQSAILNSVDYSFLLGADKKIRRLINKAKTTLGKIAYCVTGFYSGDNKRFIVTTNPKNKSLNKLSDKSLVLFNNSNNNLLQGLSNGKKYIPIVKGGKGTLNKNIDTYILWDKQTVSFYKTDKKARFQNSQFYFKYGIGVPMVKSNKINAFLIKKQLFDQSVVGVFPKDNKYINYLLGFLNSNTCNKIIKTINHTANNSANYLKKLPIIFNTQSLMKVDVIMNDYYQNKDTENTLNKLNGVFRKIYGV